MKLKIYLKVNKRWVKRDGSVNVDDVWASTYPPDGDYVPLGHVLVDFELPDNDVIMANTITAAEQEFEKYRVECFAKMDEMLAKINELRALEPPK